MTPEEVRARVAVLDVPHDAEQAHMDEDALRADVLRAIADGTAGNPTEMARLALTTADIKFERWYA